MDKSLRRTVSAWLRKTAKLKDPYVRQKIVNIRANRFLVAIIPVTTEDDKKAISKEKICTADLEGELLEPNLLMVV